MRYFNDQQELRDWLDPLGYEDFWRAVSTFDLRLQSRQSCDEQIAFGLIDAETVLAVLKGMVRLQVIEQQDLKPRDYTPDMAVH